MNKYSMGYSGGISLGDLPMHVANPGHVFYVADGDTAGNTPAVKNRKAANDDNNDGSYLAPFKTLDYAVSQCTASRGDIIYVLPGYVDTIAAISAIDIDVAGVSVLGVGSGDKQPLFQFDATTSSFNVNGANITIKGLHFAASITACTTGVVVEDGSDDFHMSDCRFTVLGQDLTVDEFDDALHITTSDRFLVENCYFDMDEGSDAQSAIHLVGICLGGTIRNNYITGDYAVACIESITAAQEQIVIEGNVLWNGVHANIGTIACIVLNTGTTGVIFNNTLYTNVSASATAAIAADACYLGYNTISTTAETGPVIAESHDDLVLQTVAKTGVADTPVDELFAVTGTIDVWGIVMTGTTDATNAPTMGVITVPTDASKAQTLVATSAVGGATTEADTASSTTVGGSFVETVAPGDVTPLWTSPARVTAGQIDTVVAGTSGNLVGTWILYYTAVTSDGVAIAA